MPAARIPAVPRRTKTLPLAERMNGAYLSFMNLNKAHQCTGCRKLGTQREHNTWEVRACASFYFVMCVNLERFGTRRQENMFWRHVRGPPHSSPDLIVSCGLSPYLAGHHRGLRDLTDARGTPPYLAGPYLGWRHRTISCGTSPCLAGPQYCGSTSHASDGEVPQDTESRPPKTR